MKRQIGVRAIVLMGLVWAASGCALLGAESPIVQPGVTPQGATTAPPIGSQEGFSAPDFGLQNVHGQELILSDLRGQVVMLNFWAVWCGFCRVEMPEIQAAYEAYQSQGFTVLGIDVQEEADTVRQFGKELSLTFPLLLDLDAQVTRAYQVRGLPTSLFIDQEGIIFAVHVGPLDQAAIADYLAQVGVE